MAKKKDNKTLIDLFNDFWERNAEVNISQPATVMYFYLLNRINRNFWQPVFLSDYELAKAIKVSRRRVADYRTELTSAGLILAEQTGAGRTSGTNYNLAGIGQINSAQRNRLEGLNSAERNRLADQEPEEIAPKGTMNSAERNRLAEPTHYNDNIKTLRHIVVDDARAREEEFFAPSDIEVSGIEIIADDTQKEAPAEPKNSALTSKTSEIENAAKKFEEDRRRAELQGREILKAFFADNNTPVLEQICMNAHIAPSELQRIATEIVAEWAQAGTTHDNPLGRFDIRDGIRHLQRTIPKRAAGEAEARSRQGQTQTRDQTRRQWMQDAAIELQAAAERFAAGIASDTPEPVNPF